MFFGFVKNNKTTRDSLGVEGRFGIPRMHVHWCFMNCCLRIEHECMCKQARQANPRRTDRQSPAVQIAVETVDQKACRLLAHCCRLGKGSP